MAPGRVTNDKSAPRRARERLDPAPGSSREVELASKSNGSHEWNPAPACPDPDRGRDGAEQDVLVNALLSATTSTNAVQPRLRIEPSKPNVIRKERIPLRNVAVYVREYLGELARRFVAHLHDSTRDDVALPVRDCGLPDFRHVS